MQADTDTPDVVEAARREMDDAKMRLSDAAQKVKSEAMNAGTTLSSLLMDELDRRAADLGTTMRGLADRLRSAAQPAEENGVPPQIVTQAVDVIEDLSAKLENSSVRDIGDQLSRFGRDNPVAFMLGCLATGVLAGRFLIASSEDEDQDLELGTTWNSENADFDDVDYDEASGDFADRSLSETGDGMSAMTRGYPEAGWNGSAQDNGAGAGDATTGADDSGRSMPDA